MKAKSHKLDCLKKLYLTYDQVLFSQDIFYKTKERSHAVYFLYPNYNLIVNKYCFHRNYDYHSATGTG